MHFDASVTAGHELCTGFISPVVELGKLLKKGDPKGAMAVFEDERIIVSPFVNPRIVAQSDPINLGYYPDWGPGGSTCLNDGKMPGYMRIMETYTDPSLSACCERWFSWDKHTCNGNGAIGSSEWYVDWILEKCVKDCYDSSDADCGGFAKSWDERYGSSQDACCDQISSYIARDKCTVDK
mmetsp:Transcript_2056/g.3233  ORF Transcript_2056/g.3233 Transcript_2056/m.3233 type:complete len:181 (-) Transcript_2056:1538-2080(-)